MLYHGNQQLHLSMVPFQNAEQVNCLDSKQYGTALYQRKEMGLLQGAEFKPWKKNNPQLLPWEAVFFDVAWHARGKVFCFWIGVWAEHKAS